MEAIEPVKNEIMNVISQTYGDMVSGLFQANHSNEVLPIFVNNSYAILKQNMGKYKAAEQLDNILSKYGVSVSSYE